MEIRNPILRGFHPDPSLCRVGEDYYLVNSSFSYYPGVPVYRSKDLVHWNQLGYALDRPSQLQVTWEDISGGIFAPTIRYHDGLFYLITTNMTTHQNFFVTAQDPAGPWSDPIVIPEAGGIDPSLFWDEDGKVYYTGTAPWNDPRFPEPGIVCSEIDLETGHLMGDLWMIGQGSAREATSPEGPHLYQKDGWYYLLIAEGGTEYHHAVTISRSKDIHGPFQQCPDNPILTHRHLGHRYPVQTIGHGDLVECQDGSWYMVCLGSRSINGTFLLGRETFLLPVVWVDGWPVCSPDTGKVERTYPAPAWAADCAEAAEPADNTFTSLAWNHLGTPKEGLVQVSPDQTVIRMGKTAMVPWCFEGEVWDFFGHMAKLGKTEDELPFLGRRLREADFEMEVSLEVSLHDTESAGIVLLQNNAHQLRLEGAAGPDGTVQFRVCKVTYSIQEGRMHWAETEEGTISLPRSKRWRLRMEGSGNRYTFGVRPLEERQWHTVAADVDGRHLGSETAGGFVGAYVGLFASGNGVSSKNTATFREVSLQEVRQR